MDNTKIMLLLQDLLAHNRTLKDTHTEIIEFIEDLYD